MWATHEAINLGAKAFGDWLLTLRGGLDHRLANAKVKGTKGKPDQGPTPEECRNRRILLALSWLSVEDENGAPDGDIRIATGRDTRSERDDKVVAALRSILRARGVSDAEIGDTATSPEDQPGTWIGDCAPSLTAAIRDDAVWVNRDVLFEKRSQSLSHLDRTYAAQTIFAFFGPEPDYFQLPGTDDDAGTSSTQEPEFRTLARQWVSTNFGTGKKSDTARIASALRTLAEINIDALANGPKAAVLARLTKALTGVANDGSEDALRCAIGWSTGRASKGRLAIQNLPDSPSLSDLHILQGKFAEESRDKAAQSGTREAPEWMPKFQKLIERDTGVPFVSKRNLIGEFSVMLDHAARRVSIAHSWIKRAEAERQRFSEDARKIEKLPEFAKKWLDEFCEIRSGLTGAAAGYRIRPMALGGRTAKAWRRAIDSWARLGPSDETTRIDTIRRIQADWDDDEKFGDIQLFEALAVDEAKCVWQCNGKATPDPLKDYVAAHDAMDKQRRFKVPAYRHPDPLAHPVFGDFGNSRWNIRFAVHEAAKAATKKSRGRKTDQDWLKIRRGLRMGLWDGQDVRLTELRWSSKRLTEDLALRIDENGTDRSDVTRADRLGRAAAGLTFEQPARVAGLFELPDWNGRLQAPRVQLNTIAARVKKHRWDDTAKRLRDRLGWLVTFSVKLQPQGNWISFATAQKLIDASKQVELKARNSRDEWRGIAYPFWHPGNEGRKGYARHGLSRMSGLRALSVDLGHRFAAACAVWETMSPADFQHEIASREIVAGGTTDSDLYLHTRHTDAHGKRRTTVYRRIGEDLIRDPDTGKPTRKAHPAPWARLDRQFLIKLQGEEKPARAASKEEIAAVAQLEFDLGRVRDAHSPLPRRVDKLMAEAVRTVRLALRYHGDAARIAYAFNPDGVQHTPGGGSQPHTTETRMKAVRDALVRWYERATSPRWRDGWASQQWDRCIKPHLTAVLPQQDEDARGVARKKQRHALEDAIDPVAKEIASDRSRLAELHQLWSKHWKDDDGQPALVPRVPKGEKGPAKTEADQLPEGWYARIRWLQSWLLPRGLRKWRDDSPQQTAGRSARRGTARHVGGLSLNRIATLRALYQVQKAYAMRPEPDDPRKNVASKDDHRYDEFGRKTLRVVERLREQRVKQLASRIAAAALGLGGHWKKIERHGHRGKPLLDKNGNPRKNRVWVEEHDAEYPACHAVVIENLRNYRPDELQTHRENRSLMNWSAGKVRKYLEEACQLHGLHLREVQPNYTSRQCSRTGLPGMRCDDIPIAEFRTTPWWRKAINAAQKRVNGGGTDKYDQFLVDLDARFSNEDGANKFKTIRLPRNGGDLFLSTGGCDGAAVLQADLNAAANIGLRALLDPDFPGRWWYVPCSSKDYTPAKDKIAGAACLNMNEPLADAPKHSENQRDIVNLWRNPSVGPIAFDSPAGWQPTPAYWMAVRARVIANLRGFNGLADSAIGRSKKP